MRAWKRQLQQQLPRRLMHPTSAAQPPAAPALAVETVVAAAPAAADDIAAAPEPAAATFKSTADRTPLRTPAAASFTEIEAAVDVETSPVAPAGMAAPLLLQSAAKRVFHFAVCCTTRDTCR